MYVSATGRCCSNKNLWRKIEVSMFYFFPNSLLTLHRINVLKKQTSTSYLSPSWHVTCVVASNLSEARKSVASCIQRVCSNVTYCDVIFLLPFQRQHLHQCNKLTTMHYKELVVNTHNTVTKWNKSWLLPCFGTFKMPILMFISILVFRPEGQI